jgi:hypothetical protein
MSTDILMLHECTDHNPCHLCFPSDLNTVVLASKIHFAVSHGHVTSADNNGEHVLLCDDRKVKMTFVPKVWATPTFERTSLAQQSFQHLAVLRHGPDLAFTSKC